MIVTLEPISDYPDSQAQCPTCKTLVKCHQLEYVRIYGGTHKTKLWHKECDTRWELNLLNSEVKILNSPDLHR